MITCYITYEIDPGKITEFEIYARAWIPLVNRMGGIHLGYFLPHESANDLAVAIFNFPSLAAYEDYRRKSMDDAECQAAFAYSAKHKIIRRYDRQFLRPVSEGDLAPLLADQA